MNLACDFERPTKISEMLAAILSAKRRYQRLDVEKHEAFCGWKNLVEQFEWAVNHNDAGLLTPDQQRAGKDLLPLLN